MTDPIATLREAIGFSSGRMTPSIQAALGELERRATKLERRARIEARLAAFAKGKDSFEAAWRPGAERMTLRWTTDWESHEGAFWGRTPHAYSGDGPDYHTALEAALNAAGAP